jgi:hypothetical protein
MTINTVWPAGEKTVECIAGAKFALSCTYSDVTTLASCSDLIYDNKVSAAALSGAVSVSGNVLTTRTLDTTNYGGRKLVWAITATEDSGPITVRQIMIDVKKPGDEYFYEEEIVKVAGWINTMSLKFLGANKISSVSTKAYYLKKDITSSILSGASQNDGNVAITPVITTTNYGGRVIMIAVTTTLDGGAIWVKAVKLRILKAGEES